MGFEFISPESGRFAFVGAGFSLVEMLNFLGNIT
jgi:hypothetical protein